MSGRTAGGPPAFNGDSILAASEGSVAPSLVPPIHVDDAHQGSARARDAFSV
ncbi:hypothetical protein AURDEDRAFT_162683 [Auricularia subglabra TFB-10046 SS5]|nr:hypothetical protein AURDEDRAFT_162683 [Auricularia subglabra TFB-10046 SS5]